MASYYQRITVLINSRAGKHDPASVKRVADAFHVAGADAEVRITDGRSMAREAADAVRRGSRVIVAAGGDGSVSAAAGAVAGTEAALAVLPLGTLNHFAKDLAIPLDLDDAVRVIVAGRTRTVDVGDVNGRLFVNNASIGMYARLIAERSAMQRVGRRKWLAHGVAALRVFRRYGRLRVRLRADGAVRVMRTPFVFVGNNAYQLSGPELGGRNDLAADRLHVCMAPGMSRGGVAKMIVAAVFGAVRNIEEFESLTTRALALDAGVARVAASIDGELVTLDNPLTFAIRPRAMRVIVP
jgi:diacylglycerol kinase family enzyme